MPLMSARYPYHLRADSPEGRAKEQAVSGRSQAMITSLSDIRQGLVSERVPHVTRESIANNAEIDVICEQFQAKLALLRAEPNAALGQTWKEWQIPREAGAGFSPYPTRSVMLPDRLGDRTRR